MIEPNTYTTLTQVEALVNHRRVAVNGVCLHVAEAPATNGDPHAPLAVLLHGFPEHWVSWHHQVLPLLEQGYRVWMPDMRGYNLSDCPKRVSDYRIKTLGADVCGLINASGATSCVLIGHDWGAAIAWWVAAEHPDLVHRLVIANVPHPRVFRRHVFTSLRQLMASWYMFFFQLPFLPQWLLSRRDYHWMSKAVFATALPGTFCEAEVLRYKAAWSRAKLNPMLNYYRAALRYQDLPKPGKLKMPTLIIWGKKDQALRFEMALMSLEHCDQGKLVVIEEATHWVHHDDPQGFNGHINAFLSTGNQL
jgi:epoxide hydrolase 4